MNKLLPLTYILFLLAFTSNAQNYPYLNASTGNKGDFIVDADSNIIMFHGSKIEKLDKNFNLIWANSYSDLNIKNLLLSKTGSMYFVSYYFNVSQHDRIGKVEADGSLSWCKELPVYTIASTGTQTYTIENADQLLLDRNNHLIVTGSSPSSNNIYLLKLDTLGNPLNLRLHYDGNLDLPKIVSILSDVSGEYTISAWGHYAFMGSVYNVVLKYSDLTDSITSSTCWIDTRGNMNQTPISSEQIIKSKHELNTFYLVYKKGTASSTMYGTFNLKKFRGTSLVWAIEFPNTSPYLTSFQDLEEDDRKNVFLSISSQNVNTNKIDKWIVKVDSNGLSDDVKYHFLQNFSSCSMYGTHDSITQLKHHYGNRYFYSIQSSTSLSSPLSIIKMDSTIGSPCSPSATINVSANTNTQMPNPIHQNTVTVAFSVLMPSISSTVTNLTNYSAAISSCIASDLREYRTSDQLSVYPNPAGNEISINTYDNDAIEGIHIFDVTGKCVAIGDKDISIDVSKLKPGIYFLKVKTDKGEFSRKFIKE